MIYVHYIYVFIQQWDVNMYMVSFLIQKKDQFERFQLILSFNGLSFSYINIGVRNFKWHQNTKKVKFRAICRLIIKL